MFKNAVAILDIRSSKITALIGEKSVNGTFNVRAVCEKPYDGYDSEGFFDESSARLCIDDAVNTVMKIANVFLSEIYVGVPSRFLLTKNASSRYILNRKRKIGEKDIENYFNYGLSSVTTEGYTVIDKSWVNCFTDGNNRVYTPYKQVSTSISGFNTYYLADNNFIGFIKKALDTFKIKSIIFVPSILAQAKFLFSREERYSYEILLDVDYISSSFSILFGDGVLFNRSFDVGDGHLSAYFMNRLNVDFGVASQLLKEVDLSLSSGDGYYDVFYIDKSYSFNIDSVNEMCREFLREFAGNIDSAIYDSRVKLPSANICLSLTGGGISSIRGAKEYLSKVVEMRLNLIYPTHPGRNKAEESSKLSLLYYALEYKNKYKKQ